MAQQSAGAPIPPVPSGQKPATPPRTGPQWNPGRGGGNPGR